MDDLVYDQMPSQGRVTTTCYPAVDDFIARRQNTTRADPKKLYKGGSHQYATSILPNEIVVAERDSEAGDYLHVYSSLSGLPNDNREQAERSTFVVGLALAKSDTTTGPITAQGGLAVLRAGTGSTVNTGHQDIHPGDRVKLIRPDPKDVKHITGTSGQKVPHATVPFNHAETKVQKRYIAGTLRSERPGYGITGDNSISLEEFMDMGPNKVELAPVQEEGCGIMYGEAIKALAFVEALEAEMQNIPVGTPRERTVSRLEALALFSDSPDPKLATALEVLMGIKPVDGVSANASSPEKQFVKYAPKAFDIAQHARDGALLARMNLVTGMALNNAKAHGGTLDILFGMTKF